MFVKNRRHPALPFPESRGGGLPSNKSFLSTVFGDSTDQVFRRIEL
jgi:hypothetical protein